MLKRLFDEHQADELVPQICKASALYNNTTKDRFKTVKGFQFICIKSTLTVNSLNGTKDIFC